MVAIQAVENIVKEDAELGKLDLDTFEEMAYNLSEALYEFNKIWEVYRKELIRRRDHLRRFKVVDRLSVKETDLQSVCEQIGVSARTVNKYKKGLKELMAAAKAGQYVAGLEVTVINEVRRV